MTNCPICSHAAKMSLTLHDDRYGYPGCFPLMLCDYCGHRFLDITFTQSELKNLYSNYYPRSTLDALDFKPHSELSKFRAWLYGEYRSAFRWVPKNVRILDIGCGFGQALGYHRARGCEVYGVETDENILKVAKAFDFPVHVGVFDAHQFTLNYFDYVTMDQVIEHVTDPIGTLQGVAQVLKRGGRLVLSTPNAQGWGRRLFARRWIHWHAPYHLHHFSRNSILQAAELAGLKLERARNITSSEWLRYQWIHLLTPHAEGVPSPFWGSPRSLSTVQQRWVQRAEWLHRVFLNHLVTRIFDAFGKGDSQLYFFIKP